MKKLHLWLAVSLSQQKRRGGTITSGRDNLSGGTGELSYFYNATAMHAYFLKRSINSNLLIVSLTMPTNFQQIFECHTWTGAGHSFVVKNK